MNRNAIETLLGAVVILIALYFVAFAYRAATVEEKDGYELFAKFDRADGLMQGSDVKLSGVKVGTVISQEIDPETYLAKITFTVENKVKLPKDTSVEIIGDGLLGGKYLAIVPGGDPDFLQAGDEIKYAQSSVSLESLIGKFVLGNVDEKKDEDHETGEPAPAEPEIPEQPASSPAIPSL